MNTKELPNKISDLKKELVTIICAFNNTTGLNISGVIIEPKNFTTISGDKSIIDYSVGVNIEL